MYSMFEPNSKSGNDLLEELAALEHAQWAELTRHILEDLTPENIELFDCLRRALA
jgi:hypothetical protein